MYPHHKQTRISAAIFAALCVLALFAAGPARAAAPLAGSTIGNQASATYTDASNTVHTATSNVTLTVIQQVGSFTITLDQTRTGAVGGQVVFPHTITNTGNGADTITLAASQLAGDNFDLGNLAVYADANGDGLPDNSTQIYTTGLLAAGARFQVVLVGNIPSGPSAGQQGQVRITGASTFAPAYIRYNTDTATVSNNAVIQVTESLSASAGAPSSGPYTVTLTYTNTGNVTATAVTLGNTTPAGFVYVAGSARWSGSVTALTDAAAGDPAGIAYDYTSGAMTAAVSSLLPGQSGTLTYQVTIAPAASTLPPVVYDHASYSYHDGSATVGAFNSNIVQFTITQPVAVTLTGQTVPSATQGSVVSFTNVLTNTGNVAETFELTVGAGNFPLGTTFRLLQPDGTTTMLDTNGNGTPDTGVVAPGATYNVILRATLPANASLAVGSTYSVTKTATAASNPTVSSTATDTLSAITGNTVDLTTTLSATVYGTGAGPETSAVVTVSDTPGATVRFPLTVKNNSTGADTFLLGVSALNDYSVLGLPVGWTVVFRDTANAIVTSTNLLNAGASQVINADVTIPAGQGTGTTQVYFRALSPTSTATDGLHVAITTGAYRRLGFSAGSSGQIYPGGSVVYAHTLTNYGNVTEGDGTGSVTALSLADSLAGWNAVVYYDANGNGTIDAGESVVTNTAFVSNGAAGLAPGESVQLLVKVFAPAGAVVGSIDSTTLTATVTNGSNPGSVPAAVFVSDTSIVILSDIRLLKEQSLDANGDGVADTAYSVAPITTGATPGAGICYRITVTNTGSQNALSIVVNDSTPTFTTYNSATAAATTVGSVATPVLANGAAGVLTFNVGTLAPGASAVITFAVKINE